MARLTPEEIAEIRRAAMREYEDPICKVTLLRGDVHRLLAHIAALEEELGKARAYYDAEEVACGGIHVHGVDVWVHKGRLFVKNTPTVTWSERDHMEHQP